MSQSDEMRETVQALTQEGKGLLAADESTPTLTRRFQALGIDSTPETRRVYRTMLLATPGIGDYLSGVILYEETLHQRTNDDVPLPEFARQAGLVPGIKVDQGTVPLAKASGDKITQGLDFLGERLAEYKMLGARFAKWRAIYPITRHNPTRLGIEANAEGLARYAAVCQEQGMVPIVEPEVLMDGVHTVEQCAEVTAAVLQEVFYALHRHGVALEYTLLKPNMVVPGKGYPVVAKAGEVAERTLEVLRHTVPPAVAAIAFLSGGQSPREATANLNAINALASRQPWRLTFSFSRALQEPVMALWRGLGDKAAEAQRILLKRARLNSAASYGEYDPEHERGD